jgi:hypothetical protein
MLRTREFIEKGEQEGKTLLEAMADGDTEGMQHFDGEIEKQVRAGVVDMHRPCLCYESQEFATHAGRYGKRPDGGIAPAVFSFKIGQGLRRAHRL